MTAHDVSPPRDEQLARRRRLTAMKTLATGLLLAMSVVLILIRLFGFKGEIASATAAFAEAALIGGLADWFAVHALFRRPFGLPIPHTAIVPRNKDRIGRALGRFIVDNFLAPDVLDDRLKAFELGAFAGRWLQRPANARAAAGALIAAGRDLAGGGPGEPLRALTAAAVRAAAAGVPAAPAAGALLRFAWREGRPSTLISALARTVQGLLRDNEAAVLEIVHRQSWAFMPQFIDRAIAKRLTEGLIRLLGELESADHPWRIGLSDAVERLCDRLGADAAFIAAGEEMKARLLGDAGLGGGVDAFFQGFASRLGHAAEGEDSLEARLEGLLTAVGLFLDQDEAARSALNASAQGLVRRLLLPRRRRIGRFVAEVVEGWDPKDLVDRLELQVGPDLQFIRVNGAIVGGLAGLGLHAVGRVFGAV